MHFLIRCEQEALIKLGHRLKAEHPLSRSLLAPILSDREFIEKRHAETLLKGQQIEQLAGVRELQKRQITLDELCIDQSVLSPFCRTTLLSLGVIRRQRRSDKDYVNDKLVGNYGCLSLPIWRELLATEYEHALQILIEAEAQFSGNPSGWLGTQDSFNDIVVRRFLNFLKDKNLKGHTKVKDRNGQLIVYGTLIVKRGPFDSAYPSVAASFRALHKRRNNLPGSHPYDQKGGARSKWLKKNEQDSLVQHLKVALDSVAEVVEQHS